MGCGWYFDDSCVVTVLREDFNNFFGNFEICPFGDTLSQFGDFLIFTFSGYFDKLGMMCEQVVWKTYEV